MGNLKTVQPLIGKKTAPFCGISIATKHDTLGRMGNFTFDFEITNAESRGQFDKEIIERVVVYLSKFSPYD